MISNFKVWPYLLGHVLFGSTADDLLEIELRLREDYNKVLRECKKLESLVRVREKDLLSMAGFADIDSLKSDAVDGDVRTGVAAQGKVNSEGSQSDTHSDSAVIDELREESFGSDGSPRQANEEKPEWNKNSLISSLIDTKDNLREMVDSASKRGAEAWKKLLKKSKKRQGRRRRAESEPASNRSIEPSMSFDLEISCISCGKKIIESRQRVLDGRLNDSSMDTIECLVCSQKHETNGNEEEGWAYRYPKSRSESMSDANTEAEERYDLREDFVDGHSFFIVNGEDMEEGKPPAKTADAEYSVSLNYKSYTIASMLEFVAIGVDGTSCLLLAFLSPTTCHLSNLRSIDLILSLYPLSLSLSSFSLC